MHWLCGDGYQSVSKGNIVEGTNVTCSDSLLISIPVHKGTDLTHPLAKTYRKINTGFTMEHTSHIPEPSNMPVGMFGHNSQEPEDYNLSDTSTA
jgi:hypothetical protein